jgi:hypothetical protein
MFVASVYTAGAALLVADPVQAAATPAALPAGAVAGLFDLDNKQAIHALTRLPIA